MKKEFTSDVGDIAIYIIHDTYTPTSRSIPRNQYAIGYIHMLYPSIPIYLSISIYQYIYPNLSIYPSIYLSISIPVYIYVYITHTCIQESIHDGLHTYVIPIYTSLSLSLSLSLCTHTHTHTHTRSLTRADSTSREGPVATYFAFVFNFFIFPPQMHGRGQQ